MRVAETYDPAAVPDVLVGEAKAAAERRDFKRAEELYLAAAKPELALNMYQEGAMWDEALVLAKTHLPHKAGEVTQFLKWPSAISFILNLFIIFDAVSHVEKGP